MKSALLFLLTAAVVLIGCNTSNPPLTGRPKAPPPPAAAPKLEPRDFEKTYKFSYSENTAEQPRYDVNEISVWFQATGKDGLSVNNLSAPDLRVSENNSPITKFKLDSKEDKFNEVAEIVLLVDITGTMTEWIESAKARLKEFVRNSHQRGFRTRMCISTFGDYTVKPCDRFFEISKDNPAQVREFLNELSKLAAFKGKGRDPGYPDLDENPMGALIDASKAPWGTAQRFVILVTDWGFLYSPDNQGTIGDKAPTMKAVREAIDSTNMKVFAVTRTQHDYQPKRGQLPSKNCEDIPDRPGWKHCVWDGYNTPFQGEKSIIASKDGNDANGGEWFDFDKFRTREITLDDVLNRIMIRVNTTYKLTYVVEDNGLDPSLPVNQRKVNIEITGGRGETKIHPDVQSSMPNGRPQYQKVFKVSDSNVQQGKIKVFVDGQELNPAEYTVNKGEVHLKSVPKPGAKLRFVFYYEDVAKNFRIEPLLFAGRLHARNTKVTLNGKPARAEDLVFTPDLEGNTSLTLGANVLSANDPYDIRKNEGLKIRVVQNP